MRQCLGEDIAMSLAEHTIKAIDVHSHLNHGSPFDSKPGDLIYKADIDHLRRQNKAAGIEAMFCSTFASVLNCETVVGENEYMASVAAGNSDVRQWTVIDPRIKGSFSQAEKALVAKYCVGIKLHPPCHGYSLDDFGDEIFSFASDLSAIVLIHPEREATYILPFADRYPKVRFIMAHLGNTSYADAITGAKNGNVYTDTSGIASSKNNVLEYTVEKAGSSHILFGTDTYAAGFQRGRIAYSPISEKDKLSILRYNAEKLFAGKI